MTWSCIIWFAKKTSKTWKSVFMFYGLIERLKTLFLSTRCSIKLFCRPSSFASSVLITGGSCKWSPAMIKFLNGFNIISVSDSSAKPASSIMAISYSPSKIDLPNRDLSFWAAPERRLFQNLFSKVFKISQSLSTN